MKKQINYENAKKYLYDKDIFINNYIAYMFDRTQKMFKYENLPETIPQRILEYMLQKNGNVFITKVNEKLYAFTGGLGGVPNEYYEPTIYAVANPYFKIFNDYKIGVDGILFRNDSMMIGLLPIFTKSAFMNCDCEITLNMLSTLLRVQYMMTASDDKSKASAEMFIQKLKNGDMSVIADSQFFDGVKLQSYNGSEQIIAQMIQLSQYIKASALNDIGLNANFIMKKERLITSEISVNESALLPFVENMLEERKKAVEKINAMFGTDIKVELTCVWEEQVKTHEENVIEENNKIVNGDSENGDSENVDNGSENVEKSEKINEDSEKINEDSEKEKSEKIDEDSKDSKDSKDSDNRDSEKIDEDSEKIDEDSEKIDEDSEKINEDSEKINEDSEKKID